MTNKGFVSIYFRSKKGTLNKSAIMSMKQEYVLTIVDVDHAHLGLSGI